MVLGIVSILGGVCCVVVGVPLAIGAVVTGILGISQVKDRPGQDRAMAIAGIVCGVLGIILPVVLFLSQFGFALYGSR